MNRQITLSQYRAIDLGILAAILFATQSVISLVSTTFYADQLYVVSTVGPVVGLVMMRWGPWAAIHAVFGGLLYTFLSGGGGQHYLIYGLGNLAGLGCLGLHKLLGKEKIWSDGLLTLLYGLAVQLLMFLGRALVAMFLGNAQGLCLPKFISTVVMTSLVTMLVKQGSLTSSMGILSQALCSLGLITEEVANAGLLNNPSFFRSIYQISGIWEGAGYDSIVFFAAIIAISPTSYEAAQIDGAGKMAQMKYVVLPSILSTLVIMLITRIGSLLQIGYEKVLLLYNTNIYMTADVVSTFAQRYGIEMGRQGLASTAEMMSNVVGMLLVIGANTIARKASDTSLY